MDMTTSRNQTLLERIRAEYVEMPGMSLTLEQAVRLCGIERSVCKSVLDALVESKFLSLKASGVYARLTEEAGHMRMVKASLDDYVPRRIGQRAS